MSLTPAEDTVLLAGAGRMGGALLEGWLAQGVAGSRIAVADPFASDAVRRLCRDHGVALNLTAPAPVDTLLLAVKPQMLDASAPGLEAWAGPRTAVVSILAGRTMVDLARHFPRAAGTVRAMPNLPASVGRGVTGMVSDGRLPDAALARVARWLGAVGRVEPLSHEGEIDMVTAVSGSGPAYVFLLAEVLAKAGERLGLSSDLALRLARGTVEGAGELMHRNPDVPPRYDAAERHLAGRHHGRRPRRADGRGRAGTTARPSRRGGLPARQGLVGLRVCE